MQKYVITEEQRNALFIALGEMPAKVSFNSILTLRTLPKFEEEKKGVEDVTS